MSNLVRSIYSALGIRLLPKIFLPGQFVFLIFKNVNNANQ